MTDGLNVPMAKNALARPLALSNWSPKGGRAPAKTLFAERGKEIVRKAAEGLAGRRRD